MSMIKVMKKLAALVFLLLLFTSISLIGPRKVLAAPLGAGDINLHSWTQVSSLDIVSGLTCQIIGYDPAKPQGTGCVFYNQEGKLASAEKPGGGAVAFTGYLIAAMYANPPASGVQYLADLGKNLGIVKPAYALGTGWTGLQPILPIWKAFRNIAYLFFTIIFIVIGFAIMFRVKISPQAVITIQSAIPRIVMALILVTFSYAIAGFLIDLMYVAIALVIATLNIGGLVQDLARTQEIYMGASAATLGGALLAPGGGLGMVWNIAREIFSGGTGAAINAIFGAIIGIVIPVGGLLIPGLIGGAVGGILGWFGFGPINALALLILSIVLIYVFFRLFFTLLMAYISIIISVIFAPFQIALDALPGQSGFGNWLRNLIANIAVFPAVVFMLLLGPILVNEVLKTSQPWAPPFMAGSVQVIASLIGFGILLMTPKVADMVKEALQVKPFKYGTAIGEAFGPVRQVGRAGFFYGAETGIQVLEGGATAAGRTTGWDVTAARTARRILGLRR